MHILILGAGGMIGLKLAKALAVRGELDGHNITRLTLVDITEPSLPDGFAGTVDLMAMDISHPDAAPQLAALRAGVIYHLAATVSGEAERDFEKGYRINLDGTRNLFEAIRLESKKSAYVPKFIFTSSVAVYGNPLPDPIPDDFILSPRSSYGTQKAISELLLDEYSRRGFLDGIGIRLPTIVIRPGAPNAAASSFFSDIVRDPLAGKRAVLPVADTLKHWLASPRSAIGFLLHAAEIDTAHLGSRRTLNMPGVATTVAGLIGALEQIAGPAAVALIDRKPNPAVEAIISSWPKAFEPKRAIALGFVAEDKVEQLISVYMADNAADAS